MQVLNLYAGIGCNRALWRDVEVTAVEIDPKIAEIYQARFPDDCVIIGDAHQFLEENFQEFDFIWGSPPCPTHSTINHSRKTRYPMKYPDMRLYQEIILLDSWYSGKWVIENVIPYYEPLIKPEVELDRHYFWSGSRIKPKSFKRTIKIRSSNKEELAEYHNIPDNIMELMVQEFGGHTRTLLRNGVHENIGKYLFDNVVVGRNIRNRF